MWNRDVQNRIGERILLKRIIVTSNEFVYDVLNNMVHYNEIIINKKDLANSRALKHIVTRFKDTFKAEEDLDHIILTKIKKLDANIKFQRKK